MNVSVAVQHHPKRADMLGPLLARLGPAEVVTDPAPDDRASPWRTYNEALDRTPDDATHRCILQDDVTLPDRFREALDLAIASRPDNVLALFHGGSPRENLMSLQRAAASGATWVRLNSRRWVPAVALVWPKRLVCEIVCWVADQQFPPVYRADDEVLGRALRALGETALACVPSIVQHADEVPSLVGDRARAGRDPARVAAFWIGETDPVSIPWHSGDGA